MNLQLRDRSPARRETLGATASVTEEVVLFGCGSLGDTYLERSRRSKKYASNR